MAGQQQKRYEDLVNKRGPRRRILVQLGPGLAMWVRPGERPPVTTVEEHNAWVAEWNRQHTSPKARIAQEKPRDARGRFVQVDAGAAPPCEDG